LLSKKLMLIINLASRYDARLVGVPLAWLLVQSGQMVSIPGVK